MNNIIERKNKILRAMADKLSQVSDVANLLKESKQFSNENKDLIIDLVAERLRNLTLGWSDAYFESTYTLPEAEQDAEEPTIDNDEPVTEDDLPFDGKEDKE